MLKLNNDSEHVSRILRGIRNKDGYCCCQPIKSNDSFCPLTTLKRNITLDELCINGKEAGECFCGIYVNS